MKKIALLVFFVAAGLVAFSQESKTVSAETTKWKMRFRVLGAIPPASSYDLSGDDIKISTAVAPELDFTYFFNKNFAAELILGTTRHTVKLDDGNSSPNWAKSGCYLPLLTCNIILPGKHLHPISGQV